MNLRSFLLSTTVYSLILTILTVGMLSISAAQVRTSPSYQLQSDSVNFSGGLATSSNYSMESTAGEVASGEADSSSYKLHAGYQQMQEVFLSMTAADSVVMNPSIGGITGGVSNGSTSVSVLTDSPSGYSLTIEASSNPAMQSSVGTIADYVPVSSPDPDISFITAPTAAHFGFSPEGVDIVSRFKDNGSFCNLGTSDTSLTCWDGLSTSATTIAQGAANQPGGATTTVNFRVEVGNAAGVLAGIYVATTTLTATPL